jgi:beta-glucosidase
VVRLLKGELGFQGFVVSDWGAQHDGVNSALMGLDMSMPGDGGPKPYGSLWGGALGEMVLNGSVPVWRLDDMVVRIMAAFFKVHGGNYTARPEVNFSSWTKNDTGPLHPSSNASWTTVNRHVNVQSDHALLAREIAAKSIVLLKNEGNILPLKDPGSIAIIGTDALDNPAGPNACPDRDCNTGTLAMGYGSGTAEFPYLISPATAIHNRTSHDNSTTPVILDPSTVPLSALKLAASQVSIPLVFANADAGEGYITLANNQGDRNNLSLWSNMQAVTEAIASVNPNTILILHTPGPVILDWARTNPNISAILWAGLPGQESGNALVDVLWGDINPQGRSPFTWGKKEGDWGPMQVTYTVPNPESPVQTFEEGVWIDYRYFDPHGMEPSWEFGFGMGYTSFLYDSLSVEAYNTTYLPASGMTPPAPTYGTIDGRVEANTAPPGFEKIPKYIYPWIDPSSFVAHNRSSQGMFGPKEAYDGSPQRIVPAGGASGGNKGLYEVVYTISCTVRNTGKVFGTEIPQLVS